MNVATGFKFLDTILLMTPFAALMLLALFKMDERVAIAPARSGRRRRFCEVGRDGRGTLSDPDGNLVKAERFSTARGKKPQNFGPRPSDSISSQGEIRVGNSLILIK